MRVGIVELMDVGHLVLVETLCKIFCSDPKNQVVLFTLEKHANNLKFLHDHHSNLSIVAKTEKQTEEDFLNQISIEPLDRIYVVTLKKLFPKISRWKVNSRLFMVIHNLDEWFSLSFSKGIKRFLYSLIKYPQLSQIIYSAKLHFIYPFYKRNILKKVSATRGGIVVLSQSICREVKRLDIKIPVEVIPFAIYDSDHIQKEILGDKKLRICVPGILSQYRRDYLALLDILENQLSKYKDQFTIDFLGGIKLSNPLDKSELLLERINLLNAKGFSIIIHNVQFIPPLEYDQELSKADIILGNMNVVLNNYSEYGKTKETGLPFAMIKAAKPGILPVNYHVPEELLSSTMLFHDYSDLTRIIEDLINSRELLVELKRKAIDNSKHFSPEMIYNQIVENKF
jgi:hypothetical protein